MANSKRNFHYNCNLWGGRVGFEVKLKGFTSIGNLAHYQPDWVLNSLMDPKRATVLSRPHKGFQWTSVQLTPNVSIILYELQLLANIRQVWQSL